MRYTLVGHVCQDLNPDDMNQWQVGGTVIYGGITAAQLDAHVHILTCAHPHILTKIPAIQNVQWEVITDTQTTTFVNNYLPSGTRFQQMIFRASPIPLNRLNDFPAPDILHFAPVANEIQAEAILQLRQIFPEIWFVATPQGWMRRAKLQIVEKVPWESALEILPHLNAVVFSEEDIQGNETLLNQYVATGIPVLYTRGIHGANLFYQGEKITIPAIPAQEVDLTGAGDVIATAFFIRFYETGDPIEAARFGTAAASCSIEHPYFLGIPSRQTINHRLRQLEPPSADG
jgi:sugar/nucleoside kinase (ribokinase family)